MLWKWDVNPNLPVVVITHSGDGSDLDNRLRVMLAKTRKQLRTRGINVREFRLELNLIPWSDGNGNDWDALCYQRVRLMTHQFREYLAENPLNRQIAK